MNTLSNIPKIVSIEFQKARHKHFPLLFLAALLLDCAYLFYGTKAHSETWLNIFYALPIINTLVLSVLMAVIASQSVDMEHKGAMWNLLPTLESRASIYLGKLFFGFIALVLFCTFQIGMVLLGGKFLGFTGDIPSHIVPVLFRTYRRNDSVSASMHAVPAVFQPVCSPFHCLRRYPGRLISGLYQHRDVDSLVRFLLS